MYHTNFVCSLKHFHMLHVVHQLLLVMWVARYPRLNRRWRDGSKVYGTVNITIKAIVSYGVRIDYNFESFTNI